MPRITISMAGGWILILKMAFSTKSNKGSFEKWLIPDLGQEMYKLSLYQMPLGILKSKDMIELKSINFSTTNNYSTSGPLIVAKTIIE